VPASGTRWILNILISQHNVETAGPAGGLIGLRAPEEMNALIEAYFTTCDESERPYTVSGLVLARGRARRMRPGSWKPFAEARPASPGAARA
jgi:hypothetical protein